ncbi:MAG TPA: iron-containing alcohol dehydrogenase [Kofleriaceae bacterium]|nr:iron-containing alcohol dehydrogenase [Kofleriaceae bacterium]
MPRDDPDDPIALLLEGRYPDPETGELLRAQSRSVVIAPSLDGAEADLVGALGLGRRLAVISDPDTHAALGRRVERALGARFDVQSIVLASRPHADTETLARAAARVDPRTDAIVAVGAGTINDLCKLVALGRGCPQVVFATAPSMNGYTSLSASLTEAGLKRSIRAATPVGVFFDLGVLAAAPLRLIRAGLGDSACRPTAQADWLLSHLLLDRPYREVPFTLLAGDEGELFARARALVAGDLEAMQRLVRTLVLSGFGMTLCDGSYPASQGEHLISHYVDAMGPPDLPEALHGEQTGVAAVAMSELQERILARAAPPVLRPTTAGRDDLIRRYGPERGEACWRELSGKHFGRARTDELNARLAARWGEMRARIGAVTVGAARLREVLEAAGAPVAPAQLGWSASLMADALAHARELRNRYTFLDLAADLVS